MRYNSQKFNYEKFTQLCCNWVYWNQKIRVCEKSTEYRHNSSQITLNFYTKIDYNFNPMFQSLSWNLMKYVIME